MYVHFKKNISYISDESEFDFNITTSDNQSDSVCELNEDDTMHVEDEQIDSGMIQPSNYEENEFVVQDSQFQEDVDEEYEPDDADIIDLTHSDDDFDQEYEAEEKDIIDLSNLVEEYDENDDSMDNQERGHQHLHVNMNMVRIILFQTFDDLELPTNNLPTPSLSDQD